MQKILKEYKSLFDGTLGEVFEQIRQLTPRKERNRPEGYIPYRAGSGSLEVVKDHVEIMLKIGVIDPATTPWASPALLALKKDGT